MGIRLPGGNHHHLLLRGRFQLFDVLVAYSDNGRIPSDTLEVGQYPSNPWGFHDMYGNTLEWTADWHTYYL